MKKSICCLLFVPIFLLYINENCAGQSPRPQANEQQPIRRSGIYDSWPVYRVESDLTGDTTTMSAQGGLYRLTQNIYATFLLYKTGDTKVVSGRHPIVIGDEEDIRRARRYYTDSLKTIPIEAVESIEVTDDPMETVLFGSIGQRCLIRVGLKDKQLYEAATWIPKE